MEELIDFRDVKVKKSNALIAAKYKSSLLENQLLSIGLSRIENINGEFSATIYPSELKSLTGDISSNIYTRLKKASKTMTGHTMVIEDGKGNFEAMAVITNCRYENGAFKIVFNKSVEPIIKDLTSNYTTIELTTFISFKSNQSFRLYELLRKELYKFKGNEVRFEIPLSELKCTIGLVNLDEEGVKRKIHSYTDEIDWDAVIDVAKEKSYNGSWTDFKKWVLDKAKEEIEEKSDITFTYQPVKRGKKVSKVVFFILPNKNAKKQYERAKFLSSKDSQLSINSYLYQDLYDEFEGHNYLQKGDLDIFISEAKGNKELVKHAIEEADKEESLENYPGWIIACIRRGGYVNQPANKGSTDRYNAISNLLENSNTDEVANRVYEKQKEKESFSLFLKALDMDIAEFEMIYTSAERVKIFTEWKITKKF